MEEIEKIKRDAQIDILEKLKIDIEYLTRYDFYWDNVEGGGITATIDIISNGDYIERDSALQQIEDLIDELECEED